ncbi:hypothetical protein AWM70_20455 [Paenibacillus yonginensis]|uniref:Uncharacterized protein n=1 Tax=Paenibacillus yonginensis TaxID=1462996 RepID=A0A1B1N5H7_9BACL|nr:hypothetical protein AWM70_20455 [Paenibacillus yonginensis]
MESGFLLGCYLNGMIQILKRDILLYPTQVRIFQLIFKLQQNPLQSNQVLNQSLNLRYRWVRLFYMIINKKVF